MAKVGNFIAEQYEEISSRTQQPSVQLIKYSSYVICISIYSSCEFFRDLTH